MGISLYPKLKMCHSHQTNHPQDPEEWDCEYCAEMASEDDECLLSQGLKTSEQWYEIARKLNPGFVIMDPDGWDRKNYDYSWKEQLIDLQEFQDRVLQSTCLWSKTQG